MGDSKGAVTLFDKAINADSDNAEACYNLWKLLLDVCEWPKIGPVLDRIARQTGQSIIKGVKPAEEPFFNLVRTQDLELNFQVAQAHSRVIDGRSAIEKNYRIQHKLCTAKDKLTVGYLSNSYKNHPTAHLIYDLFRLHDSDRVAVNCYSYGRDDQSAYRKNIQAGSDQFLDISGLTADQAAERICADQVDILVDLKGHTAKSRLDICAARPAPLQVRYLGMAGTTGSSFFDYIVTDKIVTPLDHAPYYSEKLVHMPHSYQMNSPKTVSSEDRYKNKRLAGLPLQGIVFAAFVAGYKIDRQLFGSWMAILEQVPGSVLWLWERDRRFKSNIIREVRSRPLDPKRIVFAKELPKPEHLARLSLADLCLDTRVVNGAATTSDALWAGVPVVTVKGGHFASRMSASILSAVGLSELITDDLHQYEKRVVALASDGERLNALREKLAQNKYTEPLFDTKRFVRNLENAFEQMWAVYQAGDSPRHIRVKDCGPSADMHAFLTDRANNEKEGRK
jgi:protein O-GlcNAc transferase